MRTYLNDIAFAVINSLESGAIVTDMEGNIIIINSSAKKILNLFNLPQTPINIFKEENLLIFANLYKELKDKGEPISRREIHIQSDEGEQILGITTSLVKREGVLEGMVFLFTDLTRIKQLQMEAEINRQLAQIGELTSSIVHEFKNPITVIMGLVELLMHKTREDLPHIYQKLQLILNEIRFLDILVSQFLYYSKPQEVQIQKESTEYIIQKSLHLCSYLINKYSVNLEIQEIPNNLRIIQADSQRLAQAIANVIRNAIEVQVESPKKWVAVSVYGKENFIVFRIEDEGPGLPPNLPKEVLFKPFFTQKKRGGTGLGLSIVKKIISAHNGWVDCFPREPKGAIFEIGIPLESNTESI